MFAKTHTALKSRKPRRGSLVLERLESRALMAVATEAFAPPDLSGLITQAYEGVNTSSAAISTMLTALETQLENGPLADLTAGRATSAEFQTEVAALVSSYQTNVDTQLSKFRNIDAILKLQGTQVETLIEAIAVNQTLGLITSAQQITNSGTAIDTLTSGPLLPLHTPLSGFATVTTTFETAIKSVNSMLTATTPITLATAQVAFPADADAYGDAMNAALYTRPRISQMVNDALTTLVNTVTAIPSTTTNAVAQTQIAAAITTFDNMVLDTTGIFGPQGIFAKSNSHRS